MFHTATTEEILSGRITDVYFERALAVLKAKGVNPPVRAEFIAKSLPGAWPWAVFTGLEEILFLMREFPVKVRAMQEGTVFYPYEPVMEIEGFYQDFCVYETALLGLMCQASGISTSASRFKRLAEGRPVISFGARRMHPVLAPMIERNAFAGGCDGVAVVKSAEIIGGEPAGTMPHALIICFGSTVEAVRAYDEVLAPGIRRVALIDTFLDEKFEAIRIAETFGERVYAMRLDTPSSRRGNFFRILEEVRWELDLRGFRDMKLYVSGGITEKDLPDLNPLVDAYGIGTAISNSPVIDFAMDIDEVDGRPLAKRGKWSGSKRVLRCAACGRRRIVPNRPEKPDCECGGEYEDLLVPVFDSGGILIRQPAVSEIRGYVLKQTGVLPLT